MHVVGWFYGLVAKPTRSCVELYRRPALLQQRRGRNWPPRSPATRACVLAGAGSFQGHLPRWAIRALGSTDRRGIRPYFTGLTHILRFPGLVHAKRTLLASIALTVDVRHEL